METADFSPDGDFVATLARDGATRIFRTDTGAHVATLDENATPVRWFAWSENPELSLRTAATDGTVRARPLRIVDITNRSWTASTYCPSGSVRARVLAKELEEAENDAQACRARVTESRRSASR